MRDRILSREERRLLAQVRDGRPTCVPSEAEPLVTVRIATFNRAQTLAERSLPSVLRQTYERLEILVIGDACTDSTAEVVRSFDDPRIRWIDLPTQGLYPRYRAYRRKVAGSHPMNAGLILARGAWIAPLDDDDEFTDDHVEVLLRTAQRRQHEMVYSQAIREAAPGRWEVIGSTPLRQGEISHGSVLYASALRFMRHSNTSWKLRNQPSDWNLWNRMRRIGVKIGFLDRVTYRQSLGALQRDILDAARSGGESS